MLMLSRFKASDLSTLMFTVTWSGFSDLDHGKSYIPYGMPWPRSTSTCSLIEDYLGLVKLILCCVTPNTNSIVYSAEDKAVYYWNVVLWQVQFLNLVNIPNCLLIAGKRGFPPEVRWASHDRLLRNMIHRNLLLLDSVSSLSSSLVCPILVQVVFQLAWPFSVWSCIQILWFFIHW